MSEVWAVDVYVPKNFDVKDLLIVEDILKYITDKKVVNSVGIEHYIYSFTFSTFDEAIMFSKCLMIILKYKNLNGIFVAIYLKGVNNE